MNDNNVYLEKLSRELKRYSVSESEIQHALAGVQETLGHSDSTPIEEFGTPQEYARSLYPNSKQRQYYIFTLIGLILAAAGFVVLHIHFGNQGIQGTAESLWKFAPLLAIPLGALIDFIRYLRA